MRTITVSKQARIISIFFVLFLSLLGSTDFRFTSHIFQLLIDYGFFLFWSDYRVLRVMFFSQDFAVSHIEFE